MCAFIVVLLHSYIMYKCAMYILGWHKDITYYYNIKHFLYFFLKTNA